MWIIRIMLRLNSISSYFIKQIWIYEYFSKHYFFLFFVYFHSSFRYIRIASTNNSTSLNNFSFVFLHSFSKFSCSFWYLIHPYLIHNTYIPLVYCFYISYIQLPQNDTVHVNSRLENMHVTD